MKCHGNGEEFCANIHWCSRNKFRMPDIPHERSLLAINTQLYTQVRMLLLSTAGVEFSLWKLYILKVLMGCCVDIASISNSCIRIIRQRIELTLKQAIYVTLSFSRILHLYKVQVGTRTPHVCILKIYTIYALIYFLFRE